jgi:glycoprotein 3-alpha-L-fucosyltransferase
MLIVTFLCVQVAWFVSNCGARNGRLQYARELSKYISVDVYGACGTKKCPRTTANKCFDMLDKDYKFYLAFENSNCKDYITEKFFVNGLG